MNRFATIIVFTAVCSGGLFASGINETIVPSGSSAIRMKPSALKQKHMAPDWEYDAVNDNAVERKRSHKRRRKVKPKKESR